MEHEITATSDVHADESKNNLEAMLEEAHQALEKFDVTSAGKIFAQAAQQFSESEKALFEFGYFLYEQNETEQSKVLLQKSIALAPLKNSKKYFALAQMTSDPSIAKTLYFKGVEIALSKIKILKNQITEDDNTEKLDDLKRLAAQGYCGLAQLETTSTDPYSKSFNPDAFLNLIRRSIEIDPYYLEAYSQLSLFYFNVQDEMTCRKTLAELILKVRELEEKNEDDLSDYDPAFFIPIVRMMVEGEIWEDGIYLMEIGLQNDSQNLEANYLYAFCLFKMEELDQAADVCGEMEKLGVLKCKDDELIQGFIELKQEIQQAISNVGHQPENQIPDFPASDDDWIDDN